MFLSHWKETLVQVGIAGKKYKEFLRTPGSEKKVGWYEIVLWEVHTMHIVAAFNWESWAYMWSVVGNIKEH